MSDFNMRSTTPSARGSGGMPLRKFYKIGALRLNFRDIS